MGAVDLNFIMKTDFAHSNSQKQLDIAVKSDGHRQATNSVDRYLHFSYY